MPVHAMFQRFSETRDSGACAAVTSADDGDARAISTPAGETFDSYLMSLSLWQNLCLT